MPGSITSVVSTHRFALVPPQETPGGFWQVWQGPSFGGQPAPGAQIACAGQNNGCLMLAMQARGLRPGDIRVTSNGLALDLLAESSP